MPVKRLARTAAVSWAPSTLSTAAVPLYLASGSVAGALDASFSARSQLEIFEVALDGTHDLKQVAALPSDARFNRLSWSSFTTESAPRGLLAGGMENGEFILYNPAAMLGRYDTSASLTDQGELQLDNTTTTTDDTIVFRSTSHTAAVRGLDFNPIQRNLAGTGAGEGQILIWDMNNTDIPYTPGGGPSAKLSGSDITFLSWNRMLPHILGTSSSNGVSVVWDLKSRREVISLTTPSANIQGGSWDVGGNPTMNMGMGSRRAGVVLAWNPEESIQLVTASEDDSNPIIMVWDLRNAHSPQQILSGHSKGILSVSWCHKDSDLLLSCGKDNRTLCWNPSSGEIIGELPHSKNWCFDVQWCSRNPDLLSVASFDGHVSVFSLQASDSDDSITSHTTAITSATDRFGGNNSDPFAAVVNQTTTGSLTSVINLKQPPKWLRRPVGATFGFGGKLVSFGKPKPNPKQQEQTQQQQQQAVKAIDVKRYISVRTISTIQNVRQGNDELETALETDKLQEFAAARKRVAEESIVGKGPTTGDCLKTISAGPMVWHVLQLLSDEKHGRATLIRELDGSNKYEFTKVVEENVVSSTQKDSTANPIDTTPATNESKVSSHSDTADGVTNDSAAQISTSDIDNVDGADVFDGIRKLSLQAKAIAAEAANSKQKSLFSLYPSSFSDTDKTITRALLHGDFARASQICYDNDRLADALLLAACGGADLFNIARTKYLSSQIQQAPYLRIVKNVVGGDLQDLVENASLDEWDSVLTALLTFAKGEQIIKLSKILGRRLEEEWHRKANLDDDRRVTFSTASSLPKSESTTAVNASGESEKSDQTNGQSSQSQSECSLDVVHLCQNVVMCYLLAGDLERLVDIWSSELASLEAASLAYQQPEPRWGSKYGFHAMVVHSFVERIKVFARSINFVDANLQTDGNNSNESTSEINSVPNPPRVHSLSMLYARYFEYAEILTYQGKLGTAWKYICQVPVDFQPMTTKTGVSPLLILRDRIYQACTKDELGSTISTGDEPQFPYKRALVGKIEEPAIATAPQSTTTMASSPVVQGNTYNPQSQQGSSYNYNGASNTNTYGTSSYSAYDGNNSGGMQPAQNGYGTSAGYAGNGVGGYDNSSYGGYGYGNAQPSAYRPLSGPNASTGFPPPSSQASTIPGARPQFTGTSPVSSFGQPLSMAPPPQTSQAFQPNQAWNDPPIMPSVSAKAATPAKQAQPIVAPFPNSAPVQSQHNYQQQSAYGSAGPVSQVTSPPPPQGNATSPNSSYNRPSSAPNVLPLTPVRPGPPGTYGQQQQSQQQYPQQHSYPQAGAQQYGAPADNQQQPYQPQPSPQQGYGQSVGAGYRPGAPDQTSIYQQQPQQQQQQSNQGPVSPTGPVKHPAGDRSHIPAAQKPIYDVLNGLLQKAKAGAAPQQRRVVDDAEKRLNALFDALNNEHVASTVITQLFALIKALEARDYAGALRVHTDMSLTNFDNWTIGVKRLIDLVKVMP